MVPRRILVTGARGFVGTHLMRELSQAFPAATLFAERFDVTDRGACLAAIRSTQPDACLHLAGIASVSMARSDPEIAWLVNLHGTLNLGEAVLAYVPDCVFLHVSTADAYGLSFASTPKVDERVPLAPVSIYGATKAAADLAIGALVSERLHAIRV